MTGSPRFVWEQKLKITKVSLKDWTKSYHHSPLLDQKEAVSNLLSTQLAMDSKLVVTFDLENEVNLQSNSFQAFWKEEE